MLLPHVGGSEVVWSGSLPRDDASRLPGSLVRVIRMAGRHVGSVSWNPIVATSRGRF
jgi:hypothetical protein